MPELPEVETTLRGISPHIHGQTVANTIIRQPKLRWRIPDDLAHTLAGQTVLECTRRAKYLLIRFATGIVLIHLGMSGSLRIFTAGDARILLPRQTRPCGYRVCQRHRVAPARPAPLRCRAVVCRRARAPPFAGRARPRAPPPQFNADYLYEKLRKQKRAAKLALMDNAVVVGVGNIYANECLFLRPGVSPMRAANQITRQRCGLLVENYPSRVAVRHLPPGGAPCAICQQRRQKRLFPTGIPRMAAIPALPATRRLNTQSR